MPETLKRLHEQLEYNTDTGQFIWKVFKNSFARKVFVGAIAGSNKDGYVQIICDQRQYRAHRLAWLFMTGSFPKSGYEIDHINGIRNDNRWVNLRLVTRSQNNMNAKPSIMNKSGHKGVHFYKLVNKWHARIQVKGKIILLGNFDLLKDAISARKQAEETYFKGYTKS